MAAISGARQRGCDVLAVLLDVALMLENSAVFQSQVGDQLVALRRLGYTVGILAAFRDAQTFDRVAGDRLRAAGVQVWLVRDRGLLRNLIAMSASLRRLQRTQPAGAAYVRGVWGAIVIALAGQRGRLPYTYDVRGALADETSASGRAGIKRRIYAALERWSIRHAARVCAVTRALADVVARAHAVDPVHVVPCCVDVAAMSVAAESARDWRRKAGYADTDLVLVYSGGLSHYQQVPAMLELWRRLRDDPRVRFLLLTNDDPHSLPAVVGELSEFGSRLHRMSLRREEVPLALAAADAGFMLRDTRELNRVASPVKFAEYLAAGLAVVASPGTGDASALIERHGLGTLVDPQRLEHGEAQLRALLQALAAEREAIRTRARQLALQSYDWQAHRRTFQTLYGPFDALA